MITLTIAFVVVIVATGFVAQKNIISSVIDLLREEVIVHAIFYLSI